MKEIFINVMVAIKAQTNLWYREKHREFPTHPTFCGDSELHPSQPQVQTSQKL